MKRGRTRRAARRPRERDPRTVRALLWACDKMRPLYVALGVQYPAFRALLRTKLVLDHRRGKGKDGSPSVFQNAGLATMLALYLLVSTFLAAAALSIEEPFWYVTLVQAAAMALLALPLLVDFSAVLLDTTDLTVLGALPISDRTWLAVRLTHVALYVGLILAVVQAAPLVAGTLAFGPAFAPVLVASALLAGVLTTCCVVLFFLVALRSLPLARLRDWMVYVQVGALLAFYLGFQLAGQVFVWLDAAEWIEARPALLMLIPPAAFGGLMRLAGGEGSSIDPWLALEAFALPAVALGLVALLSRRGYLSALAAMASAGGEAPRSRRRYGLAGRACARLLRDPLERAGAAFYLSMCAADRGFRLRAMPQGALLVLPFVLLALMPLRGGDELEPAGGSLLVALGLAPFLALGVAFATWEHARFGEWHAGRWCFDELERDERRRLVRGALYATVLRFVAAPVALLLAVAPLLVGPEGLAAVALSGALALAAACVGLPVLARFLPFAEPYSPARAQSNVGLSFLVFACVCLLALAHFFAGRLPFGHAAALPFAAALAWLAWRRFRRAQLRVPER